MRNIRIASFSCGKGGKLGDFFLFFLLVVMLCCSFFRVSHCTECKMSASNLAKVFGPTIVQNSSSNLEPMQMLQEAKWQPKVGSVGTPGGYGKDRVLGSLTLSPGQTVHDSR